jgi:hypothetical protein
MGAMQQKSILFSHLRVLFVTCEAQLHRVFFSKNKKKSQKANKPLIHTASSKHKTKFS